MSGQSSAPTEAHFEELAATGVTTIPGAIDRGTAATTLDDAWTVLAGYGVKREDPRTWSISPTARQSLRTRNVFGAFDTEIARAVIRHLLGEGTWKDTHNWGPALISFPEPGPWVLPHRHWHLDIPGRGDPNQPGVARLFGFVDDVEPEGGGTLVVEGSHELIRRMVERSPGYDAGPSKGVKKHLTDTHPWFAALQREGGDRVRQFMEDGEEIDGVRVRVRELTGPAGSMAVMLPWSLHAASPNCRSTPRFMVTHSVYRTDHNYY